MGTSYIEDSNIKLAMVEKDCIAVLVSHTALKPDTFLFQY